LNSEETKREKEKTMKNEIGRKENKEKGNDARKDRKKRKARKIRVAGKKREGE
jgi:hypothetical protein